MKKPSALFNLFFRDKPAFMLMVLHQAKNEVYASSLAKEIDCTYSHVVKVLHTFEREGLISCKKVGRLKLLELTKKGEDVAEHMAKLSHML